MHIFNTHPFFQYFPNFKGKRRLARFVYRKEIANQSPLLFPIKDGLKFKVPNIKEAVGFELFMGGIYEKDTIDFLINNIPLNGIFIDVGANIGAVSLVLAKKRPDITVYAFEASPRVYCFLKDNIEMNNIKNVNIYNLALSNKDNENLPFYSSTELFGKGSFAPIFTQEFEMIQTIRLDTFLHSNHIKPDMIKVDVEGHEYTVFNGLSKYFERHSNPLIIFEFDSWAEKQAGFNSGDAQRFLSEKKYQFKKLEKKVKSEYSSKITLQGVAMIIAQ